MTCQALVDKEEIAFENTSKLSEAERHQFAANGFLIYENVLTEVEIKAYRELITKQRKENHYFKYGDNAGKPRNFSDLLELRNAISYQSELLELMTHPKILDSEKTALVIIDLQEAFRSVVSEFPQIASRASMAVRGFQMWFGVRPEVTPQLRALVETDLAETGPQK